MKTHYEILGVPETADDDAIRAAWHARAQETHPDKGGKQEDFVRAKEAYDVLKDAESRREYDRERRGGSRTYAPFDPYAAPGFVRPTSTYTRPTKDRVEEPDWWRNLYERPSESFTHQRRRTSAETRQAYYEDQDLLEDLYGVGAAWDRSGTRSGEERPRNVFRSRFRNNGKVG